MSSIDARIRELDSPDWIKHLKGIKRGFEKECLRVDKTGMLAATPHPAALGSSLTHPMITTDYSEALLEFITPPLEDLDEPFIVLDELHRYTVEVLPEELLWAASMPCKLPKEEDIPIAEYGQSNLGQLKQAYRRGLGHRYGRIMQTIAGIHYNFSLPDPFWRHHHQQLQSALSLQAFVSEQYLGLIRNCLRKGWILPYLFGASPAVCNSFFKKMDPSLEKWGKYTSIGKYATSLRLSDLGYNNTVQAQVQISYNSITEFIETMHRAVHTSVPEYQRIGVYRDGEYQQLSDSIFQVEDEHYAMIRPKRVAGHDERMLSAIMRRGIEYIELRALDINPLLPTGIESDTVYFLDAFLMTCLLQESPLLTNADNKRIGYNHNQVVKWGRQPGLMLQGEQEMPKRVNDWGQEIIEQMYPAAALLDKVYGRSVFTGACDRAKEKISRTQLLPSAQVLQIMKDQHESYFDFTWQASINHQQHYRSEPLTAAKSTYYRSLASQSRVAQQELERLDTIPFEEYLSHYLEV